MGCERALRRSGAHQRSFTLLVRHPTFPANNPEMAVDWTPLGEKMVRQVTLYERMRWGLESVLSAYKITAAPFGGPIAVTRDTGQMIDLSGGMDDEITIYSASGVFLSRFSRESSCGRLVFLGWSAKELLYTVYENGKVNVCVFQ